MRNYTNPYQQAMMTGQFNPMDYMNQRRQQQGFTPGPQMAPAQMPQTMDLNMAGMNNIMKMIKGKPDQLGKQQWGNQGSPINTAQQYGAGGSPFQMGGLEMLKMLPQAGYGFAGG